MGCEATMLWNRFLCIVEAFSTDWNTDTHVVTHTHSDTHTCRDTHIVTDIHCLSHTHGDTHSDDTYSDRHTHTRIISRTVTHRVR